MSEENNCPRHEALRLVDEGCVDARQMVLILVKSMTPDDVAWALDANELSPRFNEEEEE